MNLFFKFVFLLVSKFTTLNRLCFGKDNVFICHYNQVILSKIFLRDLNQPKHSQLPRRLRPTPQPKQ